jgi:hypothetical protein
VNEPRPLPHDPYQPCCEAGRGEQDNSRQSTPESDFDGLHFGRRLQVEGFHLGLVFGRWPPLPRENRTQGAGQQQDQKQGEDESCAFSHVNARFAICSLRRYNDPMPRRKLYEDDETVAFTIRLSRTLKEYLRKQAQAHRRSLNQEIVWLVEWALAHLPEEPKPGDEAKPL